MRFHARLDRDPDPSPQMQPGFGFYPDPAKPFPKSRPGLTGLNPGPAVFVQYSRIFSQNFVLLDPNLNCKFHKIYLDIYLDFEFTARDFYFRPLLREKCTHITHPTIQNAELFFN